MEAARAKNVVVDEGKLRPPKLKRGGGWSVITGWVRALLSRRGKRLWRTLNHKSACLSCAWGTGGQNGGFRDELGEPLQRCIKSVEAIQSELQPAVPRHVFDRLSLGELQNFDSASCDRLGRLDRPLIHRAGQDFYEPIQWDDVYKRLADAFLASPPERVASYSSGRSSNEAAYLLQLLMRARGSNNLADCSDLCHAPSSVGLARVFGSGTSNVSLESLRQADGVVLVGSNAPANHPRLMNELIRLRNRGGTVVVINPVIEGGCSSSVRQLSRSAPCCVGVRSLLSSCNRFQDRIRPFFLVFRRHGWRVERLPGSLLKPMAMAGRPCANSFKPPAGTRSRNAAASVVRSWSTPRRVWRIAALWCSPGPWVLRTI